MEQGECFPDGRHAGRLVLGQELVSRDVQFLLMLTGPYDEGFDLGIQTCSPWGHAVLQPLEKGHEFIQFLLELADNILRDITVQALEQFQGNGLPDLPGRGDLPLVIHRLDRLVSFVE